MIAKVKVLKVKEGRGQVGERMFSLTVKPQGFRQRTVVWHEQEDGSWFLEAPAFWESQERDVFAPFNPEVDMAPELQATLELLKEVLDHLVAGENPNQIVGDWKPREFAPPAQ